MQTRYTHRKGFPFINGTSCLGRENMFHGQSLSFKTCMASRNVPTKNEIRVFLSGKRFYCYHDGCDSPLLTPWLLSPRAEYSSQAILLDFPPFFLFFSFAGNMHMTGQV